MKKLPSTKQFSVSTNAKIPGTHFGADVIRRAKQKILVLRDQFSSYTIADFIDSETCEDMEQKLIQMLTPIRTPGHVNIRTDNALGFVKMKDSNNLKDLDISLETGNVFNKNANAVIDKGIQELEREITVLMPQEKPITVNILAKAVLNLNNRLRRDGGLSARDIIFSRDYRTGKNLSLHDERLAENQLQIREQNNNNYNKDKNTDNQNIDHGDTVMVTNNPTKHEIRSTFLVTGKVDDQINIKRINTPAITNSRNVRNKVYTVPKSQVFKVQVDNRTNNKKSSITKTSYSYDPISKHQSSDDDYTTEDDNDDGDLDEFHDCDDNREQHIIADVEENDDQNENINNEVHVREEPSVDSQEERGERSKIREEWILPQHTSRNSKLEKIRQNIAATKIQHWFRSIKKKRYPTRKRVTRFPELLRLSSTEHDFLLSANEEERCMLTSSNPASRDTSIDTLAWDDNADCTHTEFEDIFNTAFWTTNLDLEFNRESTDLMRVYDFTYALPLTSESQETQKPQKSSHKNPLKRLKEYMKRSK